MSIGIGAFAKLTLEDETSVLYEYGSYNLNEEKYENNDRISDGSILIPKSCFAEPEIHEKLKKMPSGRKKLIVKRISVDVEYDEMLLKGLIKIENCSNCWETTEDELKIDFMACRLLFKIFQEYQIKSEIPQYISLVMKPAKRILEKAKSTDSQILFHSDQGVQYSSAGYCNLLKSYNTIQSMSRAGTPRDNAVIESFFGRFKDVLRSHYQYW